MEQIALEILKSNGDDYVKSVALEGLMDLSNCEKWHDDEVVEEWGTWGEWMNVLLCENLVDWFNNLTNNVANNYDFDTLNYLNGLKKSEQKNLLSKIEEWELAGNIINIDGGIIAEYCYNWFSVLSSPSKIFIIRKVLKIENN